jgi:methionyl-tRNA synthetase
VRRYNADLANDFGNLVNRTVSMAARYLEGARPAPREAGASPLGQAWPAVVERVGAAVGGCLLHEALAAIWDFVGAANRQVEADQPWAIARAFKDGDEAAGERVKDVLGDLVEACRLIALAAAPFLPGAAPKVLEQLGFDYPYADDGNGGPPLLEQLRWGAWTTPGGRLGDAAPVFPRLDAETP